MLSSRINHVNTVSQHKTELQRLANMTRVLTMDMVLTAKSGHLGAPLGCAEIGTLLFFCSLRQHANKPNWPNRDRFVLSAGHASALLYALLHLSGYPINADDLKQFRSLGSITPGHPEFGHTPGVEATTGPLGQGLANAVGLAISEKMLASRFNSHKETPIDHLTYVLAGDGCLMEGVTAEACSLAGHLKLNKLIVLYDANNITIDGNTSITFTEDVPVRFRAYGWQVLFADGHDFLSLAIALDKAHENTYSHQGDLGPTLIVCRTIPGKGAINWEGKHKIHGNPMNAAEVLAAKQHLGFANPEPFHVPPEIQEAAANLLRERQRLVDAWEQNLGKILADWELNYPNKWQLWRKLVDHETNHGLTDSLWTQLKGSMATRVASGKVIAELATTHPQLIGGSADLSSSNSTQIPGSNYISALDFSGRNIHFGIREHAMGAITNGLALGNSFRPFCATFLVFSDYLRPTIRLAALMQIPTIFIFTHDSYAVGEDGPTHQPIEHLASLRAIPNLHVIRPADSWETIAAWEFAYSELKTPSALILSRQDLPLLEEVGEGAAATVMDAARTPEMVREGMKVGGYIVKDFRSNSETEANIGYRKLVIIASGSEVSLALATAQLLEEQSPVEPTPPFSIRVISAPRPQALAKNRTSMASLVPPTIPAIAIEAAATQGWHEIVGRDGLVIGMDSFGLSGSQGKLSTHFGFTPVKVANKIEEWTH